MQIILLPDSATWPELTRRPLLSEDETIRERTRQIIDSVKTGGDRALRELSLRIDHIDLPDNRVSPQEIAASEADIPQPLRQAILQARDNILAFHQAQRMEPIEIEVMPGVRCSQRSVPISRVGLYIPGGSAPLFSTVLMLALPARVAGCSEIVLCTPPRPDGSIAPEILWTANLCGITHIYKIGGAQAIAAMAYGTETIAPVNKIFGPGNRYVTAAKQILGLQRVAIDMPAGPSEVMVLADSTARARFVAADMLSQAEHGPDSQAILVTTDPALAQEVLIETQRQLQQLARRDTAATALNESRIIVVRDLGEMVGIANLYAAEHLILAVADPESVARQISNAGSIFLGHWSPESVGDYASGTNHTLPTSGWATSFSGVNLDSFCKKITFQSLTPAGLKDISRTTTLMAQAEGLDAHAMAVTVRLDEISASTK